MQNVLNSLKEVVECQNLDFWFPHWPSCSSVQFSSVASDSLQPHELQCARTPCPSPTPWVHPNPCPLCWWCHPTISSAVVPFSSCPQSFPASGSFQMSQFFVIRWPKYWSFSFIIGPSNEHPGLISFRMDGWISLQSKGLSRVFSNTTVSHQRDKNQIHRISCIFK